MDFVFTPDKQSAQIDVPFYEDAKASFAPYYSVVKTGNGEAKLMEGKTTIGLELGKLGAIVTAIMPGTFGAGKTKRYAFVIRFMYGSVPGEIKVAGLPMRSETIVKKIAVQVQALWNVRDWLKSAVTSRVFSPGSDVLIPYLLWDGKRTIVQIMADTGKLPELIAGSSSASSNVIDGEFSVVAG